MWSNPFSQTFQIYFYSILRNDNSKPKSKETNVTNEKMIATQNDGGQAFFIGNEVGEYKKQNNIII